MTTVTWYETLGIARHTLRRFLLPVPTLTRYKQIIMNRELELYDRRVKSNRYIRNLDGFSNKKQFDLPLTYATLELKKCSNCFESALLFHEYLLNDDPTMISHAYT